ncbi:VOC family protein [Streptomyces sp. NPDC005438]|uniref:VOC family protein n=1 Tax=Streptomyces sp. NPDC005438 TaxID=3156880 RepID=UPI0033B30D91
MGVAQVYAVLPVDDIDSASTWYERLFGRPADLAPMDGLLEWQVTPGGALQVVRDQDRSGQGMLTLGVDDIDEHTAALADRGVEVGEIVDTSVGFRISTLLDPAGNTLTLAEEALD